MHHQKTHSPSKKLVAGILATISIVGVALTYIGSGSDMLLSQFSSSNVTPSNASTLWKSSDNNTYRTGLSTNYAVRLDAIIVNMLARGASLEHSKFVNYVGSVHDGLDALAVKPAYAGNSEVQNMIGYIKTELRTIKGDLSAGNLLMADIENIINSSYARQGDSGTTTTGNTGGTTTTTGGTTTGTTTGGNTTTTGGNTTGGTTTPVSLKRELKLVRGNEVFTSANVGQMRLTTGETITLQYDITGRDVCSLELYRGPSRTEEFNVPLNGSSPIGSKTWMVTGTENVSLYLRCGGGYTNYGISVSDAGTTNNGGTVTGGNTTTGNTTPVAPKRELKIARGTEVFTSATVGQMRLAPGETIILQYDITGRDVCSLELYRGLSRTEEFSMLLNGSSPIGSKTWTVTGTEYVSVYLRCGGGYTNYTIEVKGSPTSTGPTLPTTAFYISADTMNVQHPTLYFKIAGSYGYKGCTMVIGEEGGMQRVSSSSYTMGNGSSIGLGSYLKADGTFEGSMRLPSTTGYVNLYCQKSELALNAQGQRTLNMDLMERLISPASISSLTNNALTSMSISPIPGSQTVATSNQLPTVTVDKTTAKSGETVNISWTANGGTGCYTTLNGKRATDVTGASGTITETNVPAGTYTMTMTCSYAGTQKTSTPVNVTVSIDHAAEVRNMFATNAYTKMFNPVPNQVQIDEWTQRIIDRGLEGARTYFTEVANGYGCQNDPAGFYFANNLDVKAYYDSHPSENVGNSGARKHWDMSGKTEGRKSCW